MAFRSAQEEINKREIRYVPEKLLIIDGYQRSLKAALVKAICKDFDPDALGILTVAPRPNGRYAVIDGQHRLAAIRIMTPGALVRCDVISDLSYQEEAKKFLRFNGTRVTNTATDKFRALLAEGNPAAIAIKSEVEAIGYELPLRPRGQRLRDNEVGCIQALQEAYQSGNLRDILLVTRMAWGSASAGTHNYIIFGLNILLNKYHEQVNLDRLVAILQHEEPSALVAKATVRATSEGGHAKSHMARMLRDMYNKGLRTNRLPVDL